LYDDALRPMGLKLTQYALMRNIRDAKGPSITALADGMMMDRTTLTRNLAPLRKSGWVQVDDTDGRTRALRLTREGREVLDRAVPVWRETEERVRHILGEEDAMELRARLDTASANLRAAGADPAPLP
jgi:DNA-binding MarR family transcriptional regulator